jgi:hypothetical protein
MKSIRARLSIVLFQLVVLGVPSLLAQSSVTIKLTVDATHAPQKFLHTHMVMPVNLVRLRSITLSGFPASTCPPVQWVT